MIDAFRNLTFEAAAIWSAGGWAMVPIAIVATCLFALAMRLRLALRDTDFVRVSDATWRRCADASPDGRRIASIPSSPSAHGTRRSWRVWSGTATW